MTDIQVKSPRVYRVKPKNTQEKILEITESLNKRLRDIYPSIPFSFKVEPSYPGSLRLIAHIFYPKDSVFSVKAVRITGKNLGLDGVIFHIK